MAIERNSRKEFVGKVTSAKMDKSIVVAVENKVKHPKYKKYFTKTKKLYAHDETNQCGIDDIVRIQETRPLSKLKRWRLIEVIQKAK
ncbi:MAG: 30S ribosomal protein S17 [Bacteroidetes bacterium]|nr:30S ribosomal protein S17 [Bacteroidota bacterium]